MSEWSAEERLEQIRGILGQTTRRRPVRDADGTLLDGTTLDWIAEIQRKVDHLRGLLNGTVPLPSPPPTPPPETRDMDQDSPSIPPSIGAESEIRQSAPIRQSEIRQQAAAATRDCLVPATLSADSFYRSHVGLSDDTLRCVRRRVTAEEPRVPETQQEPQQEQPATAPTTTGDNSQSHTAKSPLWKPVSDEEWGATHTQPSDGETQSTATLPEID
mgnify:FL=1